MVQRTRAYETERDIQRGLLVGFSWSTNNTVIDFTTYVFNPDDSKPTVVPAVAISF